MQITLSNLGAIELRALLHEAVTQGAPLAPRPESALLELAQILADLSDAIDDEAERQHLARSYPESDY